jgi:hypothetical protein
MLKRYIFDNIYLLNCMCVIQIYRKQYNTLKFIKYAVYTSPVQFNDNTYITNQTYMYTCKIVPWVTVPGEVVLIGWSVSPPSWLNLTAPSWCRDIETSVLNTVFMKRYIYMHACMHSFIHSLPMLY